VSRYSAEKLGGGDTGQPVKLLAGHTSNSGLTGEAGTRSVRSFTKYDFQGFENQEKGG